MAESNRSKRAMRRMESARPASGYRPKTEAEWQKVQAASVELAYAMYRDLGMGKVQAKAMAELSHGGSAGRSLLELSFSDNGHE